MESSHVGSVLVTMIGARKMILEYFQEHMEDFMVEVIFRQGIQNR
jgi:hypothetical protein